MKMRLLFGLLLFLLGVITLDADCQTFEVQVTEVVGNGADTVSFEIRRTGSTAFVLATTSLVMNYDTSALGLPALDFNYSGPWDFQTDRDYNSVTLSGGGSGDGFAGLLVEFVGGTHPGTDNDGLPVPTTFRRIGALVFPVTNPTVSPGFTWRVVGSVTQAFRLTSPGVSGGGQTILAGGGTFISSLRASAKVFLQGPYNTATHQMDNTLRTTGVLAAHFGAITIPTDAVDSITVEIRNAPTAGGSTLRLFKPAWLLQDGSIVDFVTPGNGYVAFTGAPGGNYYIVIWHRNHLAIMSSTAQPLTSSTPAAYDFSVAGQAYGLNPSILVETGIYAMYAGDANASGIISASDANEVFGALLSQGYLPGDANLSGIVSTGDANVVFANLTAASQVSRPVQISEETNPVTGRKKAVPPARARDDSN
jgi:hypothetical protein